MLCLLDINISRKHCVFSYNSVDQNWTVTDYSSNGVTVNGIRVQKYVAFALADGDQIILADQNLYSWTFQVPLTPISNNAAAVKGKVMVMDEDNQEVAEGDTEGDNQEVARAEGGKEEEDRANQFMAIQTGEDNQSFIKLQVEREKHGAKNAWMYKDEAMYLEMKAQQMALPSMEQQAALPYKPGNVDTWTYQNINSVFHNPDGFELTEAEKIEKAKKEKIIIHNNTRISKTPWKSDQQVDKLRKEVEQREALAAGKVGQAQDPLGQRVQADVDDPEPGAGRGGLAADDLGPGRDHALHAGRLRHAPGHLGRRPGPGLPDPRPQRPGQDRAAAGGQ